MPKHLIRATSSWSCRTCPGHPPLGALTEKDLDARHEPWHDGSFQRKSPHDRVSDSARIGGGGRDRGVGGVFVSAEIVTFSFANPRARHLSGSRERSGADRSPSEWPALRRSAGIGQNHSLPWGFLPFP